MTMPTLPIAFDTPYALLIGLLALLPWLLRPQQRSLAPYLPALPADPLSQWLGRLLRLAGSMGLAAIGLALAGPHLPGGQIDRIGHGAHLVLVLDRSSSMNEAFSQQQADAAISKAAAAKQLLSGFASQREQDHVGVVAFSTMPMPVLPLGRHPEALGAAISAIDHPGLAHTDIGRALLVSLRMLQSHPDPLASRAILLVSDGAGVIGREVQEQIRASLLLQPIQLYWLFLRSAGTPSIYEKPADSRRDTPQAMPERHLNLFFASLGIPYLAFEAESPAEVAQALAQIDEQEQRPLIYQESIPRTDLGPYALAWALACVALLLLAHLAERRYTYTGTRPA